MALTNTSFEDLQAKGLSILRNPNNKIVPLSPPVDGFSYHVVDSEGVVLAYLTEEDRQKWNRLTVLGAT